VSLDEQEKRDLLRILSHAFAQKNLDGLVFLDIQKIFYYLRERLDDSNSIKESLPYYWYVDGCMSDTVKEAVDYGAGNQILIDSPTKRTQDGTWYQPENDNYNDNRVSDDLEDAFEKVELVLDEDYNVFDNYESKIKQVYQEAPLEFQGYFKTELLWAAEDTADEGLSASQARDISSKVMLAESYLPLDRRYSRFNDVYSRYSTISQKYLDKTDGEHSGLSRIFSSLTEDIWKLFCKQLRICEHDPYYDDSIPNWQSEYDEMEERVTDLLSSFDKMVNAEFENSDVPDRVNESNGWGPVAKSYLSGTGSESD
jgi:hypothetical protein